MKSFYTDDTFLKEYELEKKALMEMYNEQVRRIEIESDMKKRRKLIMGLNYINLMMKF